MAKRISRFLALALAAACACSGGSGERKAGSDAGGDGGTEAGSDAGAVACAIGAPGCPTLDPTVTTNLAAASAFLYTGPNPIQKDVDVANLDLVHIAVVRGHVFARSSTAATGEVALPGVTVTVPGHPEFGSTTTQADGWFSMVVNGGGLVSFAYELAGYLPAQRATKTRWLDYSLVADLVMTKAEPGATVTLSSSSKDFQVVRGLKHGGAPTMTPSEDTDGARTATLLIPPGTTATNLASLNDQPATFRATEFTTGSLGPQAMPADMSPTTAYTYAADFSIDEANGASVSFSQPIVFYLENFIGVPVGNGTSPTPVPVGFFDTTQSVWVPTPSGQNVRVLSNEGGSVTLDLNGAGTPAADSDFTPPLYPGERAQIAALYTTGQEIWRTGLPHFSVFDCNYAPADAEGPNGGPPTANDPKDKSCLQSGSIIECENQILAEQFAIPGTPFALRYQSERTWGYLAEAQIPLTGATAPPSVLSIQGTVEVAGRKFSYSTPTVAPNEVWSWTWDHKDAFGRILSGHVVAHVGVGYTYALTYDSASIFGHHGTAQNPITANRAAGQLTIWQYYDLPIDHIDAKSTFGLGDFSITAQNLYDPTGQILYGGDGTRESANGSLYNTIATYAGGAPHPQPTIGDGLPATQATLVPYHIALGPDGSLYIADGGNGLIRKVDPTGIINTLAGTDAPSASSDPGTGKPAKTVAMHPYGVAIGPDSSVYVTTSRPSRVLKIDGATGVLTAIAGTGSATPEDCLPTDTCGEDAVATSDNLATLGGVAVGPDGSVYFSEVFSNGHGRVRMIANDGALSTVVNSVLYPDGLSFGPDGSLYAVDTTGQAVLRLTPGGTLSTVAGGHRGSDGDGGPATMAGLFQPMDVVVGSDGSFYISDNDNSTVRYVDPGGIIRTITSLNPTNLATPAGDGGPAGAALLSLPEGLALATNGTLYIADTADARVRLIQPPVPGFTLGDALIPSQDGSVVYRFDPQGRHLFTYDATNGQTLLTLAYGKDGFVSSVTDANQNTTSFDRSKAGAVVIHAPFGQETTIALDASGYAKSLTDPAGSTVQFTYGQTSGAENGLLSTLTDPKGQVHSFTFTSEGLLTQDKNPAGGEWNLAKTLTATGWNVNLSSRLGRVTTYQDSVFTNGGTERVITAPSGIVSTLTQPTSGAQVTTVVGADGSALASSTQQLGPDPRWGMQAPLVTSSTTTTGGVSVSVSHARSVTKTGTDIFDLGSQTDTLTVNPMSSQPLHVTIVYTHGAASNTEVITTGLGRTVNVTLDTLNRVTSLSMPGLGTESFTYNSAACPGVGCGGRVTGITQTSANPSEGMRTITPKYGYTPDTGFASSLVDSLGLTSSFTRDPVGRVTGASLPVLTGTTAAQNQLGLTYDKNGNVSTIAVPSSASTPPVHGFPNYSPIDLLETYEPPQATPALTTRNTTYGYDLDGQLKSLGIPNGSGPATVSVTYDDAGRLLTVADPKGATRTFNYATSALLGSIVTSDGSTLSFSRTGPLVTGAAWIGPVAGTIAWTYDSFFRASSRTVGATTVSYAFDNDSFYVGTTAPASFVVTRDVGGKNGLLAGSTLGSIADTWSYNGFGEPAGYSATYGGTPLYTMSGVSRDAAGRITAMTENVAGVMHTWVFAYDPHGDLITATRDGTSQSYVFDPNGNRTSINGATQGPYDAQDRLVSTGTTYTSNGDLLTSTSGAGTTTYAYDLSGNLRSVALASGDKISYVIDGQNRRIGKTLTHAGTPITQGFLYDDQLRVAAELDGSNNVVSVFAYGTRRQVPDYMVRGGNTYRIVSDWRGSVRAIVDANAGTVVETIDYDAWGNPTTFTDSTCNGGPTCFYFQPFGFAGGIYDKDTGLVRFGARDYNPTRGRWTQKDASGFGGGTNFYAYAFNDPVNFVDLTGREPSLAQNLGLTPQAWRAADAARNLLDIEAAVSTLVALTIEVTWPAVAAGGAALVNSCGSQGAADLPALPAPEGYNPWVGDILSTTASEDLVTYRVWGGDAAQGGSGQLGSWLMTNLPSSADEARSVYALPAGNTAAFVSQVIIPAGTRFQIGLAAAANGQPGGGLQIWLLERIPASFYGPGVPLGD